MKQRANRRDFLKAAAATAVACPYLIPGSALGADGRPAPSERIVMGGIGIGNQGRGDQEAFLGRSDVQYVAVCDVNERVRNSRRERRQQTIRQQRLQGLQRLPRAAGPHRYRCRALCHARPLACDRGDRGLPPRQGRVLPEARDQDPPRRPADGCGCPALRPRGFRRQPAGTGRLSRTVNQCWSGEIGPIKSINVNVDPPSQPCYLGGEPVPQGFDWDMWLGPAPWAPYHPYRCSGSFSINGTSWRSFSDYSGGHMTDWGAHHFGGAIFAIDCREFEPEEVIYNNEDGQAYLTSATPTASSSITTIPARATSRSWARRARSGPPNPCRATRARGGIYGDFIECVKTREKPFRDIELAAHTIAVAHLGIIAYQLKRSLKWDAAKNEFPGDEEANRLVDRARREPWTL